MSRLLTASVANDMVRLIASQPKNPRWSLRKCEKMRKVHNAWPTKVGEDFVNCPSKCSRVSRYRKIQRRVSKVSRNIDRHVTAEGARKHCSLLP